MSEVQTKDEFHSYITNNLNIDETDEIADDLHTLIVALIIVNRRSISFTPNLKIIRI